MNNAHLMALREGRVSLAKFLRDHRDYFSRMARRFYRPLFTLQAPLDVEDLEQLAKVEVWESVREYRYFCPHCPRSADTPDVLARHGIRVHGVAVAPRGDLFTYVHNRVGRKLDHEVRRHTRRRRFIDSPRFGWTRDEEGDRVELDREAIVATAPNQLEAVHLAELVEIARQRLGERGEAILRALALEIPAGGEGCLVPEREELREELIAV